MTLKTVQNLGKFEGELHFPIPGFYQEEFPLRTQLAFLCPCTNVTPGEVEVLSHVTGEFEKNQLGTCSAGSAFPPERCLPSGSVLFAASPKPLVSSAAWEKGGKSRVSM